MNSNFTTILRIILALGLLVFGLNKFVGFIPQPELSAEASDFMNSLLDTGYVLYFLGILEILIGLLLLLKRWVPFALLVLVPISVNILLFHIFLDIPQIIQAVIIAGLNAVLIMKYWKAFRPLFQQV
jgi:uncharacterized membrane protein YphA (DoxX/SURF4 family)